MKKTVIVNGKARRIEFSYAVGETISLSNTEIKKPWGRVTERVTVSKLTFTINGKTYEGKRTFKVAGGPYSETFEFDGNSFASHKKFLYSQNRGSFFVHFYLVLRETEKKYRNIYVSMVS